MGRPRSSKSSVARLLDQVSFPILLIDDRRVVAYCNPACVAWLGVPSEDSVVGQRCDYHSRQDTAKSSPLVAGLCPSLEAFAGTPLRATVFNPKNESRSAQFVPLNSESQKAFGVLVLIDDREFDSWSNARKAESGDVHQRIANLRSHFARSFQIERMVGSSAVANRIRSQVQLACSSRPHVAVHGPRGSGREHLLRTIHYAHSKHETRPLIPLTCELLDAELLQTTVETFIRSCAELDTDAVGALLLLEADRLARDAQAVLVGFLAIAELQIQVLSTSRVSLIELAGQGEFRRDLAFALTTLQIEVPALQDRPEDIPDLAQAQLECVNARGEKQVSGFSKKAMDQLSSYSWPGNIDELVETVVQSHKRCGGSYIECGHLPEKIHLARQAAEVNVSTAESIELDPFLEGIEIELLQRSLKQSGGNKSKAAKLLGLSRGRLLRRLEHFGIGDKAD